MSRERQKARAKKVIDQAMNEVQAAMEELASLGEPITKIADMGAMFESVNINLREHPEPKPDGSYWPPVQGKFTITITLEGRVILTPSGTKFTITRG